MPRGNLIKIRRGASVPNAVDFEVGEPAFDGSNLYIKNANSEMVQIGGGGSSVYKVPTSIHVERTKNTISNDNIWICPISPNYGVSEDYGNGSSPTFSNTNPMSFFVPAGTIIKTLQLGGIYSGSNLNDLKISIVKTDATDTCWQSGINGTCQANHTEIYNDDFYTPVVGPQFTGNFSDLHYRRIGINNLIAKDSIISCYMKPDLSGAGNGEYFQGFWTFELVGRPVDFGPNMYMFGSYYHYDGTYVYYGGINGDGDWKINRYDGDGLNGSATEENNSTYTEISTAWAVVETLNY